MQTSDDTTGTESVALPANVVVGEDCWIENPRSCFRRFFTTRQPGMVLGDRVRVLEQSGFGLEPEATMTVGDDSTIISAVFMCAERITIGARAVLSYGVTITDADFHPLDPVQRRVDVAALSPGGDADARPDYDTAPVEIGDDVHIAMFAIVLKGVRIGPGARVGPGAVVTHDVPPGATVIGNPARLADADGRR